MLSINIMSLVSCSLSTRADHLRYMFQTREMTPRGNNPRLKPQVSQKSTMTSIGHFLGNHMSYIPKKMNKELPSAGVPVVLTCGRKTWKMFYSGVVSIYKINVGWKKFVDDNNPKEGDGLVFELSECSADKIHFRVQILRVDLPAGLISEGEEGASSNYPIVID